MSGRRRTIRRRMIGGIKIASLEKSKEDQIEEELKNKRLIDRWKKAIKNRKEKKAKKKELAKT